MTNLENIKEQMRESMAETVVDLQRSVMNTALEAVLTLVIAKEVFRGQDLNEEEVVGVADEVFDVGVVPVLDLVAGVMVENKAGLDKALALGRESLRSAAIRELAEIGKAAGSGFN